MKDRNRKIVLTAAFGIIAVMIALAVIFFSTGRISADAIVWGGIIIALLVAVTAVKTGKKKQYNYAGSAIGVLMIIAGLVLSVFSYSAGGKTAGSGMITGGVILFVICLASLRKPADSDIRDERSLKIGTWAIAYSWYLTLIAIIVMFWLSYIGLVVMDAYIALGVLILLMPLSSVAFQWYFSRKGDVY